MLEIIPSSGSKNDTSMKPMNIQSRITMAGSITDMNRDSLASVSSSQDVHICCMTSSIDPVLLPIAIQLEYIFEKILECSSASENVSPLDIFTAVIYFRIKDRIVYESLCQIKTTVCVKSA